MFRVCRKSCLTILAALLACPSVMLAQRGAGGGRTGGSLAGGSGLSGVGKPSGVDVKDDLKSYHEALAVQATSQQIVEYTLMVKSTETANAELKSLVEELGQNSGSVISSRSATLDRAIEKARTENKKFLDGFSERQKSGLKEITKNLIRADSDLAQQAKALDLEVATAKAVGPALVASTQNLERALASFQSQQRHLGEEMSIGASGNGQDSAFNLPPVKNSVNFSNLSITTITSGIISQSAVEGGQSTYKLKLTTDLSDLQQNIADLLRTQLNKADPCGERIEIHNATLTPQGPVGLVVVQLHYERWTCLGKATMNEMMEGNGTIEVKLNPLVGQDADLRLTAQMGRVDAQGMIGELLRSGSLGDTLRDKITETVLSAVRQGGDFKAMLPPSAQGYATLRRAQFESTGSGKILAVLDGEIRVPTEKAAALTAELKGRSAAQASSQASSQETPQQTVPR
jgi:hypothetical protein